MLVSVAIAWKDLGCPHRAAAFDHVIGYWETAMPEAEIIVAASEPFTRAASLNKAVRLAHGDVILQSDPDSFVPLEQAYQAVALASAADGLVVPFDRYLYLDADATSGHLAGGPAGLGLSCEAHGPGGVGNVTAYSRRTWEQAGGYDERFGVWAGDDGAFAFAAGILVAPYRRLPGPVFHLWHPRHPDSVVGSDGYLAQMSILSEYRDAAASGDASAMRDLVALNRPVRAS